MTQTPGNEIPVERVGPGAVQIGVRRGMPTGGVVIVLPGAHVTIDPARPESVPVCLVVDPDAAAPVVHALYGADVANTVVTLLRDEEADGATVAWETSGGLHDIAQLASVRWCRRFSRYPLDDALLWLEECTLIGRLHAILEDEDDWPSELEAACRGADEASERGGISDPAVDRLVVEALELLATSLPVTDPVSRRARERLLARGGRDSLQAPDWSWTAETDPGAYALVAGDRATSGVATVDWFDVPRGLTSMGENNVRWAAETDDDAAGVAVHVEGPEPVRRYGQPAAALETPEAEQLAFDAYVHGWPFAVAAGELSFDTSAWAWTGVSRVGEAQAGLIQDAIEAGRGPAIRVRTLEYSPAQNPAWALAHRWTCRGLAAARLACGDTEQVRAAGDVWQRAADLWRLIERDDHGDECERLAADLAAGRLHYALTAAEMWLLGHR